MEGHRRETLPAQPPIGWQSSLLSAPLGTPEISTSVSKVASMVLTTCCLPRSRVFSILVVGIKKELFAASTHPMGCTGMSLRTWLTISISSSACQWLTTMSLISPSSRSARQSCERPVVHRHELPMQATLIPRKGPSCQTFDARDGNKLGNVYVCAIEKPF